MKNSVVQKAVLFFAIALTVIARLSNAQDSVFYMWNEIIDESELDESSIVALAYQSSVELKIIRLYLDVCQNFQPLREAESSDLARHFATLADPVNEFLDRYTVADLEAIGITASNPLEQNYQDQKSTASDDFYEAGDKWVAGFCKEFRAEILAMPPSRTPKRFR